jgi:hypothetical protein
MSVKDDNAAKAAKKLSQRGASKGGRARASVMTPEERHLVARQAARARWGKSADDEPTVIVPRDAETMPYSMFRGTLSIGDVEFECHVLSDGRRVLTQREVVRVISGGRESGNLGRYLDRLPGADVQLVSNRIVQFKVPGAAQTAHGYEAELLVEICEMYLEARHRGELKGGQHRLARMAEAVIRACAKVGIIALIDEATGYQEVRQKQALQLKLQAFIADEMQEWAKMFPDEFWYELARLEGIHYSPRHRPLRWGKYVMAFVYDAVDRDDGRELRKRNPNPHFGQNHHQWLKTHGRDKLNNQIQQVIAVMKLCDDMKDFRQKFDRVFKKTPLQLSFDQIDWDSAA